MSVADVVGGQAGISVEIHRYPKRDNSAAATTIDPWLIVDGGCFLLTCPYPPVVDDVRLLLTYPCRPGDSTPSPLVYCVCVFMVKQSLRPSHLQQGGCMAGGVSFVLNNITSFPR